MYYVDWRKDYCSEKTNGHKIKKNPLQAKLKFSFETRGQIRVEQLKFADDCVQCCYCQKGAIFKNYPDTLLTYL